MESNNKPVRRRRSVSEIKSLLKEQAQGGELVNEFCKRHQITRSSFYKWCSKYGPVKQQPAFVPVQLSANQAAAIFAEIEFHEKASIRLFGHVDASYIKALLQ